MSSGRGMLLLLLHSTIAMVTPSAVLKLITSQKQAGSSIGDMAINLVYITVSTTAALVVAVSLFGVKF